jgi:CBS domain-containing protein
MNIGDICHREIVTADEATPVAQAARLMRDHHIGALVVTRAAGGGRAVLGLLTDRDLVVDVLAHEGASAAQPIGPLAHGPAAAVPEHASVPEALERMQLAGVRRLLVAGDDGQLAGIVTLDDLLGPLARPLALLAAVPESARAREAAARAPVPKPALPRVSVPAVGTAGWHLR